MSSAPCIFLSKGPAVISYVDDPIVFADSDKSLETFKNKLSAKLIVKDFGGPSQFLGIQLDWSISGAVRLNQTNLIKTLIGSTGT